MTIARGMRSACGAALAIALVAVTPAMATTAKAGASDRSFGRGGFLYSHEFLRGLGEDGTAFESLRLLSDGSMAVSVVERCGQGCREGVLARYTATGAFASKIGYPVSPELAGDGPIRVGRPLVAPDGALVLGYNNTSAGPAPPANPHFLAVTSPLGSVRQVDLPVTFSPQSVLPGGSVVGLSDRTVVRLRPDLAIDPTFGSGGRVSVPRAVLALGPVAATASAVRVAGFDLNGLLLARYNAAGQLLRVARVAARVKAPNNVNGVAQIAVRGDGRALLVGRVWATLPSGRAQLQTVIAAFGPDGRVDGRFGQHGIVRVAQGDARVALQRDGRIVVASSVPSPDFPTDRGGAHLVVRRLTANGHADPSFETRRIRTRVGEFMGLDVAVDSKGRIVVAGGAFTVYGSGGVMFARFLDRAAAAR